MFTNPSLRIRAALVVAPLLLGSMFTGCVAVNLSVGNPLQSSQAKPRTEFYAGDKLAVFEAMTGMLERMGYRIEKAEPNQGVIEARTPLLDTDQFGASRQFVLNVKLRDAGDEQTAVEILVSEEREGEFKAGPVSVAYSEHGRYDSVFERLAELLGEGSWLPPSAPAP